MDRTGIIVVTLCVILLGVWFVGQQKNYLHPPQQQVANTNTTAAAQTVTANSNAISPLPNVVSAPVFDTNKPEELLVITNARVRYTFTSRGGGLKSVELLDYPETVSPRWKKTSSVAGVATLNTRGRPGVAG
jgi:YidC/Oxa1 family membrane protein insertase